METTSSPERERHVSSTSANRLLERNTHGFGRSSSTRRNAFRRPVARMPPLAPKCGREFSSEARLTPPHPASAMFPSQCSCSLFSNRTSAGHDRRRASEGAHPDRDGGALSFSGLSRVVPSAVVTSRANVVGSRRERGFMPLTPPVARRHPFGVRRARASVPSSRQRCRPVLLGAPSFDEVLSPPATACAVENGEAARHQRHAHRVSLASALTCSRRSRFHASTGERPPPFFRSRTTRSALRQGGGACSSISAIDVRSASIDRRTVEPQPLASFAIRKARVG